MACPARDFGFGAGQSCGATLFVAFDASGFSPQLTTVVHTGKNFYLEDDYHAKTIHASGPLAQTKAHGRFGYTSVRCCGHVLLAAITQAKDQYVERRRQNQRLHLFAAVGSVSDAAALSVTCNWLVSSTAGTGVLRNIAKTGFNTFVPFQQGWAAQSPWEILRDIRTL